MGLFDFFRIKQIKAENEKLQQIIDTFAEFEGVELAEKIVKARSELQENEHKLKLSNDELFSLENHITEKKKELLAVEEEISFESFAFYKPKFELMNSAEYKERLQKTREWQKAMISAKSAVVGNTSWTVNNNKTQGNKMVNNMMKLVLRSFNNECDYCVDNVKFNNIETYEKRITKSYESLNKLAEIMGVYIHETYLEHKLDELHLSFEYQQKKQEEKEEQKLMRAELREQAKLEQEIRQAREKIEKERKHYNKALKELTSLLEKATTEEETQAIQSNLLEINNNLNKLSKEESVIDYREKNAKAGYVYIISNIGSFGEGIYKIGMTRRLEPMERVDELGDASVPFKFDVHALIFSENAPTLESKLHQHFSHGRINKMNNRKEFFRADIKEIEMVIKENYTKVFDLIEVAPAEQYRESLLIENLDNQ